MTDTPKDLTADEVADIFSMAGSSVVTINKFATKPDKVGKDEWQQRISANVNHLEGIKKMKKIDGTTSIWTTEDFTAIDAAIAKGKSLVA